MHGGFVHDNDYPLQPMGFPDNHPADREGNAKDSHGTGKRRQGLLADCMH